MKIEKIINKKPNEKVILKLRRHPFTLIPAILIFLLINLITIAGYYIITIASPGLLTNPAAYASLTILGALFLINGWIFSYGQFVDYYLDMWVVTDDRIVSIEQHGLFGRTISELDLFKIQDVTSDVRGFFPSTFQYGFVHIQTAGEKERFVFEQVPHPHTVRKSIIDLVNSDRRKEAKAIGAAEIMGI